MNVLLVKPYNLSDHIQPSLGLGYLATAIKERHEVEILDSIKEKVKPNDFESYVKEVKPDVVGIQCYTFDLNNIRPLLESSKRIGARTVLGGPHPSSMPLETIEFFGEAVDYVFRGEAEVGFAKLVDKLGGLSNYDEREIEGLVWRDGEQVRMNDICFVEDLDSLGWVAWDLIKPETYPEAQHGAFFKKFPIAPITLTRGCPFSCTFCGGNLISGKRIRKRSVENAVGEIKMLHDKYGIKEFHVIDDNFTFDREFAKKFLRELETQNLDISWAVPNGIRMETLDDEILELMKRTGLYLISLGIESGSDRILRLMKKGTNTNSIRGYVELIRKHHIDIAGFFILGFPGETVEEIRKTIRFSLELDLLRANFFTYLPFPGTESYKELELQGHLNDVDFKRFYFMNASFTPEGIDRKTLKALQREAFLKFFLRPKIFFRNARQIQSYNHFRFLVLRFFRWIFLS